MAYGDGRNWINLSYCYKAEIHKIEEQAWWDMAENELIQL